MGEVTGLEELEGFGRECGSPGEQTALSCDVLGILLSCTAGGGKGFVLLVRCKISVGKGGVFHFLRTEFFPGLGWVSLTWVVCTVPSLQVRARGSSELISG